MELGVTSFSVAFMQPSLNLPSSKFVTAEVRLCVPTYGTSLSIRLCYQCLEYRSATGDLSRCIIGFEELDVGSRCAAVT